MVIERQLFSTDIVQALEQAHTPTLGNPFATLADIPVGSAWDLNGNTNGSEQYIGTNDNFDFPIVTNNVERVRISAVGNVGIGYVPNAFARLRVAGLDFGSVNYAFVAQDSVTANLFSVRNDGYTLLMDMTIGRGAGLFGNNTVLGVNCLQSTTTGQANTAVGYLSLKSLTSGADNTAVGYSVLVGSVTGNENTAVGNRLLTSNGAGSNNQVFGSNSATANTSGSLNIIIGTNSFNTNTTGSYNVVITPTSGLSTSNGDLNFAAGYAAGNSNNGSNNIFLGSYSGLNQTAANYMLFIDNRARTTAANELTNSLIVGTSDASLGNQRLRFNANVGIGGNAATSTSTLNIGNLPVSSAGLVTGDVWNNLGVLSIV